MSIESVNITKEYVRRGKTFRAVDDVSISVPKGKITVVTGNSGSGKSTLLNILAGMIVPEGGTVRIDDTELLSLKNRERDKFRGKKIGIVPQVQSLIGGLTVRENIELQKGFSGSSGNNEEKLAGYVKDLGIEDLLDVFPSSLSGGEMKRAAVVRAISGDHEYIFADEPTGELDPENASRIMDAFRKQADEGRGILLITHDSLVEERADILYRMEKGRLSEEKAG
jgi:ABC-type lipoprotein export system ATPase subunit